MIPIELTIQGLYSYQERQTIDFTKLTAANLFGIFGTVGSGKSSILEAITFAIYGRTDRLNLSGDNRYYNMMNLRSNELLIDFIFETGKDQARYRATARCTRNSRNFDEVRAPERGAYRRSGGDWIPIAQEELEIAVGLSYDNFKRTIIIPQGQFQEFLQLGNRDRTRMMKELFNLEKYEFFYKVVSLEKKNDKELTTIKGKLQQLGDIDPIQVKVLETYLTEIEDKIKVQSQSLQHNQQKEEALRTLKGKVQEKKDTEVLMSNLRAKEPQIDALQKEIHRYEQGVIGFKHLLDSLRITTRKKTDRETRLKGDLKKLHDATAAITRLEEQLQSMMPAYEKREQLNRKAEELGSLLQMKNIQQQIIHAEGRLKNGTKLCEDISLKIDELKVQKEEQEEKIRILRENKPDLSLLSSIKAWHIEHRGLLEQARGLHKEFQELDQKHKEVETEQEKWLTDPIFATRLPGEDYTTWLKLIETAREELRKEERIVQEKENHWRVRSQLKTYAEELEDNKPCPLCGSLHHPDRFSSEDMEEERSKLSARKQACENRKEKLTRVDRELALLWNRQKDIDKQKSNQQRKVKEVQEKIEVLERAFTWNDFRDEVALDKAFTAAKEGEEQLIALEKELRETTTLIEEEQKKKARYQETLEEIKTLHAGLVAELRTRAQQLTLVLPNEHEGKEPNDIQQEVHQLQQQFSQLEKSHKEYTDLLRDQERFKGELRGVIETNTKELEEEKRSINTLQHQLQDQLHQSEFKTLEEVTQLLSEPINIEEGKQTVDLFKEQLLRVQTSLEQLTREIGDRKYDSNHHEEVVTTIELLKKENDQLNQEHGKVTDQLKRLLDNLSIHARLQADAEKLETRAENIRTMKSLFKASGFVNYVSSVYLQNLCHAANDRFFQLTRQQLSLEITEDNNFQVRDFLNGGKVRNVKTLSGGQTFQASLSLALALADNIQHITQSSQNFFFLDEGFGSLDKESLNVVFDTLKTLRKENRVVGVISHVEEMQQEIDVHLRIENDPEQGSLIHPSWE